MREFTIKTGSAPELVRALVCGLPSAGKTFFAGSAPKPLFLSDASEGGYKTLQAMDSALWWDPKVPPEVWAIEAQPDMPIALGKLEQRAHAARNGSGPDAFPWRTIVIDPLSIYVDRYLAEMMAKGIHKDPRQYYGDLNAHLRSLVLRFHALPAHVLWLCHVKNEAGEVNGPAIGGQMGSKFPAFCDFKWFCNVTAAANLPPVYELRTAPFRSWTFLGGRWVLPDPMIPSFKCVAELIDLGEKPVSPSVPGFPGGVTYRGLVAPPALPPIAENTNTTTAPASA